MANEKIDLRQGNIAHLSRYGQPGSNSQVPSGNRVSQAQSAKVVPSEKCVKFAQTQNLIVENKALLTR
jgi:hypothetical protein